MFTMADTIGGSLGSLPKYGSLVGGETVKAFASYVDNFGGYPELVAAQGKTGAELLSITIFGNRARCADFEKGGMVNTQAAGWLDNIAEPDPILYTFASNAQALYDAAGNRVFKRWQAHTGQGMHLCGSPGRGWPGNPGCQYPDADATQWVFDPNGVNIDLSVCLDDFLVPPPPPPADPHHYDRFPNAVWGSPFGRLRERDIVLRYDGARKHALRYRLFLAHDLEPRLHWLADRAYCEAHRDPNPDGSPSWGKFYRGWRFQELSKRARGIQLVRT